MLDSPLVGPVRAFPVSLSAEPHPIISTSPLVILLSLPYTYFSLNFNTNSNDDQRAHSAGHDAYWASRRQRWSVKPDCEVQFGWTGKLFLSETAHGNGTLRHV
jgi:hypothetical protein